MKQVMVRLDADEEIIFYAAKKDFDTRYDSEVFRKLLKNYNLAKLKRVPDASNANDPATSEVLPPL